MIAPTVPTHEAARLQALASYDILDSLPEQEFDDLTYLAAEILETPIAVLSLIDAHRQWFKSRIGLAAAETPREVAFCAHTILGADPLVVTDSTLDPRFRDNPLVIGEPHVRFYAGIPLITEGGHAIGALCAIDHLPRTITTKQLEALRRLARQATTLLELRLARTRALAAAERIRLHELALRETNQKFRMMVDAVKDYAIYRVDVDGLVSSWNVGGERLTGFGETEMIGTHFSVLYTDEDREAGAPQRELAAAAVDGRHSGDGWRRRKDGTRFMANVVVTALHDSDGHLQGYVEVTRDVTERDLLVAQLGASETRYRLLVENQSEMVSLLSSEGELQFVNQEYARHFGLEPLQMVGTSLYAYLPENERDLVRTHLASVWTSARPLPAEHQMLSAGGEKKWIAWTNRAIFDASGNPVQIHSVGRDVTDRKRVESDLARINERFAIAAEAAGFGYWEFNGESDSLVWDEQMFRLYGGARPAADSALAIRARALHPDDRLRGEQELVHATKGYGAPFRVIHPDGLVRHLQTAAKLAYDKVSGAGRMVGVTVDVTEAIENRVRLATVMRENQGLLSVLHEYALISVTDVEGRITDVNSALCKLSGFSRSELLGRNHRVFGSGTHPREFWSGVWRCLHGGKAWRGQICNRGKSGGVYWIDCTIAPFAGADGRTEKYISICTDITTAKLTEQKLRASETFLSRVGAAAGVGGWELDLRTEAVTWSHQTYVIHELGTDYEPNLADGLAFYAPEARATISAAVQKSFDQGTGWDLELPLVTAKGRPIWVRTVGTAEFEQDKAVKLVGAFQDITSRKQIEAQLRETNERFKIASDSAGIGIWEFDVATRTLVWDDWMYEIYGVVRDPLTSPSATWINNIHADDQVRCRAMIDAAMRGEGEFDTECRIVRPDGQVRTLQVASRIQRDLSGTPLRMTGICFDISKRKRSEEALLEASSLLSTVLDSASEIAIIAMDPNLKITVFNTGAERLLGYTSEEMIGEATMMALHDPEEVRICGEELSARHGYRIEAAAVFTDALTHRHPREWTYIRKTGERITVSLVVMPMFAIPGELSGYVGVAYDVTRQKQYEESLRKAIGSAEHASGAKSEFLANMSHEIRTPLNAVIGLGYLLDQTTLNQDQRKLLAKIQFAGRSLLGVVNNVLDLSKVEAGEMTLESEVFDLPHLVNEIRQLMEPQAQAKGITFIGQTAHDLPRSARGDALRLRQILMNLANNSIKFTESGHVELNVWCVERHEEQYRLRFEVVDTGIGIASDSLERLFTPFIQADTSTTRRFGGTGLGLSIARRLVELMGGTIGVTSVLGSGSTFWIEVPLRTGDRKAGVVAADDVRSLRVVVAAAHDESVEDLDAMVRALGWSPITTDAGIGLLEALAGKSSESGLDVVILDLERQDTTPSQLLTRLKDDGERLALPPMVLVVDGTESYLETSSSLRKTDVMLVRPVTSSALFNAINSVWQQERGYSAMRQPATLEQGITQCLVGVRVLVVDDSDINLEVAQRILERQGAVVATCSDGEAALAYVLAHKHALDVVLMDVQMPILDGNEATRRIRKDLTPAQLPIIALTAGALVGERQRSLEAGMNDFISKPFDPQAFIRKVRSFVPPGSAAPKVSRLADRAVPDGSLKIPVPASIDAGTVEQLFGNDVVFFKSLLWRVLDDYADLALLQGGLVAHGMQRDLLAARMHKLKGSAGMVGATQIMRLAGAAESLLKDASRVEPVGALLQELATALTSLRHEAATGFAVNSSVNSTGGFNGGESQRLSTSDLQELIVLLENQDLAAMDKFECLAGALAQRFGPGKFGELKASIDNLEFQEGARRLRAL